MATTHSSHRNSKSRRRTNKRNHRSPAKKRTPGRTSTAQVEALVKKHVKERPVSSILMAAGAGLIVESFLNIKRMLLGDEEKAGKRSLSRRR